MKIITDIKVCVKIEIRFLTGAQMEISSDIYYPVNSYEELEKQIKDYENNNLESMAEDKEYDFIFYPKLYFFEEDEETVKNPCNYKERNESDYARVQKLKPLNEKGEVEELFHYIEEILYVNTSREIQHNFGYDEIDFFIENL